MGRSCWSTSGRFHGRVYLLPHLHSLGVRLMASSLSQCFWLTGLVLEWGFGASLHPREWHELSPGELLHCSEPGKMLRRWKGFFFPDDRLHWRDKRSLLSFPPYLDPTWIASSEISSLRASQANTATQVVQQYTKGPKSWVPLLTAPWLWTKCICSAQSASLRLPQALRKPLQHLYNFRKQLYSNLKREGKMGEK